MLNCKMIVSFGNIYLTVAFLIYVMDRYFSRDQFLID